MIIKKKYFLIIESIKDIDLKNIKKRHKFSIIYRNKNNTENLTELQKFRKSCKSKSIEFFVGNDLKLAVKLESDGIYLSSYNSNLKVLSYKKSNFKIIGSAHNFREINTKNKQGCGSILLSKLFFVKYDARSPYLGVIKFNKLLKDNKNLIPLGGINLNNVNNLKIIDCKGFALMSEVKKKPAKIFSRLF